MVKHSNIASIINIVGNLILFISKIIVGLLFSSIALISDAINSLSDIISSVIIYYSIKISSQKADKNHPFGHSRSEPIAALVSALIMWVLAYQIIETGIQRIINNESLIFSPLIIYTLIFSMIIKLSMYVYSRFAAKIDNSPGIDAAAKDHLNDILISFVALIGILVNEFGINWFDSLAGFIISLWIIKVGYELIKTNIDFLMGKKPSDKLIDLIKSEAIKIEGVMGLNDVYAQYLGSLVQVEIHIDVDKKTNLQKAHDIGKMVKNRLEKRKEINNAFVHIDPK